MLTLVKAIRTALRDAVSLDYIRDKDIFVTPHVNFIPPMVKDSFIGIKDGRIDNKEETCGVVEKTGPVIVSVFVRLIDFEKAMIGEASSGTIGVLEAAADVAAVLRGNLLNITGMQAAVVNTEDASDMFLRDDGTGYQRKKITITYVWEE